MNEVRATMTLTAEAVVAVQAGLATRPDSLPTVATIDVPVLAIAGGEDLSIAPSDMAAFQNAPGGCAWHLLPDAGHLAAFEQPAPRGGDSCLLAHAFLTLGPGGTAPAPARGRPGRRKSEYLAMSIWECRATWPGSSQTGATTRAGSSQTGETTHPGSFHQ